MKYLILILLLVGCGKAAVEETHEITLQDNLKKGNEYAASIYGKCYKKWTGTTYLIEKATLFYKDSNGSQFCALENVCDFRNKTLCVVAKSCSEYSRNDYLKERMEEMKMVRTTCPKGITK